MILLKDFGIAPGVCGVGGAHQKPLQFEKCREIHARVTLGQRSAHDRIKHPVSAAVHHHSWGDSGILQEDHHDASQAAVADRGSADEPAIRRQKIEGLIPAERDKVVLILAQILTQAVGLNVEELEDDKL